MENELRCIVTGNPCGTDTTIEGITCHCESCKIWWQEFCKSLPSWNEMDQRLSKLEQRSRDLKITI